MWHRLFGQGAQARGVNGDVSPAEDDETFLLRNPLNSRDDRLSGIVVYGKKGVADGVGAGFGQREARDGGEKLVRNLRHNSGAVSGTGVRTHGTAVLEVSESVERNINNVVAREATHGGYQRKPAGVLVVRRIEETGRWGHSGEAMVRRKKIHVTSPRKQRESVAC
jgi:hypothetical protein